MARERKSRKKQQPAPDQPAAVDGLQWSREIVEVNMTWEWEGYLPSSSIVLIEGRKSVGKSTLAAAIAAAVTGGRQLPGLVPRRGDPVIWDAGEDAWPSVVLPRLRGAGANIHLVARPDPRDAKGQPRRLRLPGDILILEEAIRKAGVKLLVLDPFASAADPNLDLRIEQQARAYLEPLAHMLAATGCFAILTRHLRKGQGGDARDAGLGSVAVGNVARVILRCDEHPHLENCNVMSVVSCNYGRRGPTLVYRINTGEHGLPFIDWGGTCDLTADAIAEGRGSEADRDEWSEADRLLHDVIGSTWVVVALVAVEAERAGITPRMIRRAKARLRIPSRRVQRGQEAYWEWGPPSDGWPEGLAPA